MLERNLDEAGRPDSVEMGQFVSVIQLHPQRTGYGKWVGFLRRPRITVRPWDGSSSPDPENAGADSTNPQSWNGYSYVLNNPLTNTDPDGMDPQPNGTDPCGTNPNCVTVYAKLDPVATVAAILLVSSANVLVQTNQMAAESWELA